MRYPSLRNLLKNHWLSRDIWKRKWEEPKAVRKKLIHTSLIFYFGDMAYLTEQLVAYGCRKKINDICSIDFMLKTVIAPTSPRRIQKHQQVIWIEKKNGCYGFICWFLFSFLIKSGFFIIYLLGYLLILFLFFCFPIQWNNNIPLFLHRDVFYLLR